MFGDFGLDVLHELLDLIGVSHIGWEGYGVAGEVGNSIELVGRRGEIVGVPRGYDD
jgi:hypothetical protein